MLILSIIFVFALDLGAVGFGLMMVIGQLIGTNLQLIFISKYLDINYVYLVKHQIFSILLFILLSFLASLIELNSHLISFIVSGLIYTILSGVMILFFPSILSLTKSDITKVKKIIFKI